MACAVVLAALLAWWLVRRPAPRPTPGPPTDALASLEAKHAYLEGVELVRANRSWQALPYFRHALALRPDLWQIHCDYAAALLNSEIDVARHRGILGPVSRSSWERAAGAREAFQRFASAETLAASPHDRAYVEHVRGTALGAWGLAWDAIRDHRLAASADPGRPELARSLSSLLAEMQMR